LSWAGTCDNSGAIKAASRPSEPLLARRTFDVGLDTGTPVVEDYAGPMPFRFTGKLEKVTIDLK